MKASRQKADHGAQVIKFYGTDGNGNHTGRRADGARIILKAADASNTLSHIKNLSECPLSDIDQLGLLGPDRGVMLGAAQQFEGDWRQAGLAPRMGATYERHSAGNGEISDKAARAHTRWRNAIQVLGPRYSIVGSVVLARYVPRPRDTPTLRLGLMLLAKHYRDSGVIYAEW